MKFITSILLCFLSLFLVTSCTTSYLTSTYNNSSTITSYNKIVVVAKSKSQGIRANFEQQIAAHLSDQGINAIPSALLISQSEIVKDLTKNEIEKIRLRLVSEGIDGVIVTTLIDQENYVDVIPGTPQSYPTYMHGYGRYWGHYPVVQWEPDRLVSGTAYYLESALYDITVDDEDNLHWVANFKVKDPGSVDKWTKKYATDLSNALIDPEIGGISIQNQ